MRLLGRLLASALPVIAGRGVAEAWIYGAAFPLERPQAAALHTALLAATAIEAAAVAAALAWLARPIAGVLGAGAGGEDGGTVAAVRAVYRMPLQVAGLLGAGALGTGIAVIAVLHRHGLADDLAAAAGTVALAVGILGAMIGHGLAAVARSEVVERLGTRVEVAARGTVRGKILALGFALNTIGVLLFAGTGYVRYRADADREYVAAASRAQAATIAAAGSEPGPQVAEQVWRATGSPSALLGPDGRLVARFGPRDAPLELARGAPVGGAVALEDGWLVTARGAGGVVASWLPEAALLARRREFLGAIVSMALAVYVATALLVWVAARAITAPFRTLGRAADLIASGDLTVSPASVSRDEIGTLAADFRRMAQGLKALVSEVQQASQGVSLGAREAAAIGEQVRAGAAHGHEGAVSVQAAVEAMERSMLQVSGGVGGLSEYVAATNRAMGEMTAAFEDVSRKGIELERAMGAAVSDVDRLGEAGQDAEARLGHLETLSQHAGDTLSAVKASMSALERAAAESGSTAEHVAEMAERAGSVVEETAHGIESLRAAVGDAHRRVEVLGRRSDDIDQVVDFISEVAGRTNLLSLNASIIAAQAGEHGKPFGVVAEQIRELAAQIARSTKSITEIVRAVRDDVEGTAGLIDRGDALAGDAVQLARKSLDALSAIQLSTGHARDTAVAIRMAVGAHAQSSAEVARVFDSIAEGARAATGAVQLVGRSVAAVNSVSRGVDAIADQVAHALQGQAGLGRRQIESLRRLEQMIADIGRAVEAHDAATRRVREALQHLTATAGQHEDAVEGLASVAERLGAGAKALAERVDRFRV